MGFSFLELGLSDPIRQHNARPHHVVGALHQSDIPTRGAHG